MQKLDEDGNTAAAQQSADALLDTVLGYAPAGETAAFREADLLSRMVAQLSVAPKASQRDLIKLFRTKPALAQAVVWTIKPGDDIPRVYALLDRLRRERPDQLDAFANLAAAVCVVYDKPPRKVAFETPKKPIFLKPADPLAVFDYFTQNDQRMVLGIKGMPPGLLVYVVDMTEPQTDWDWALAKYKGDAHIGRHYDDVQYDKSMLHPGGVKKWVPDGWSLQNILKYGGVCEDQAYFASGIAKANGIPACFVSSRSGQVGHAWVGAIELSGRTAAWNFSYGRFGDYNNLRGTVVDPQTGEKLADGTVALLAESLTGDADACRDAIAMTDCAERLAGLRATVFRPAPLDSPRALTQPRKPTMDAALELLDAGLRRSPAYVPGWELLARLSTDEQFTLAHKKTWSTVLEKLCGTKYPDFSFEILRPMIKGIKEAKDRDPLWDWAAQQMHTRPDLVAAARFEQGDDCEAVGDKDGAWKCYQDVIARFPNAGPFMVDAVHRCDRLLHAGGRTRKSCPCTPRRGPSAKSPALTRLSLSCRATGIGWVWTIQSSCKRPGAQRSPTTSRHAWA